jgi:hypothetical protein
MIPTFEDTVKNFLDMKPKPHKEAPAKSKSQSDGTYDPKLFTETQLNTGFSPASALELGSRIDQRGRVLARFQVHPEPVRISRPPASAKAPSPSTFRAPAGTLGRSGTAFRQIR